MSLAVMNLSTNTIDTFMIAYFLTKLLNKRFPKRTWSILFLIILIIFNTLVNLIFGLGSMLGFGLIFIVSTIFYSYLLNIKIVKTLIGIILAIITMSVMEVIAVNLVIVIFNIDPVITLELNIYRIIAIIIAKFLFYLIIKYKIRKINMPNYSTNEDVLATIIIGLFNIIIISMTFILYKNIDLKSSSRNTYLISMALGSIIFSWLIYRIIKKMIFQNKQQIIWSMREEELHKKDFYMKNMNDILHTIRSQKHDINNYLSTLYGLIYLEKFEEAKKYITGINDRFSNIDNIVETNHPVITSLVSLKANKAFEENIEIVLDIDLPEELQFDFVDLSIIIGNLLDNAIEACQLVKEDIIRKIKLSTYIEDEYLIIETINTKSESIKLDTNNIMDRFTTKSEDKDHGYGLGNIEYIVKQYSGIMDIDDLGDKFSIRIALTIKELDYVNGFKTYAI